MKCLCSLCKTCKNRIAVKKYRENNPQKRKESIKKQNIKKKDSGYFVKWYSNNEKARKDTLARNKKRAEVSPEKVRKEIIRHNEKHRDRYLARQWLRRAVSRGKIIKPLNCEKCGLEKNRIEGHHKDYSKRLEVEWLCVDCYKKAHGKL